MEQLESIKKSPPGKRGEMQDFLPQCPLYMHAGEGKKCFNYISAQKVRAILCLCSPRLHLFDQIYSKNSNVVKCFILKYNLFSRWNMNLF